MGLAIAARDDVLNTLFRGQAMPALPATYYVALLTTNPSDETGTGAVEVSTSVWTNYARQPVANSTGGFSAPAGGASAPQSVSNAAKVDFGTAAVTGTAPVVTGFAIKDAASAGVWWGWGALTSSQTINNGDPVSYAIGALVMSL